METKGSDMDVREKQNSNETNSDFHSTCFACGVDNPFGLHLQFEVNENGVRTTTVINQRFQSYEGVIHGGILATILDSAMLHCLHSQFGHNPITCRLDLRYRQRAPNGEPVTVQAFLVQRRRDMCWVRGTIQYGDKICAEATGVFRLE
jgi:acyl-coenzyme A thioesterase PaaI-like protein